jgi:CRP/FNR family transcriptional regulator, cyclic AMP receptor protein
MTPNNQHYIRCLEALKDSVLFKNLDTDQLYSILDVATREKWELGTFKNSSEIHSKIHFVVSGRMKVYQINPVTDREHTIFILTSGDIFDILSLLDNETHDVYWEVIDTLEILNIPIGHMRKFIATYLKLNKEILNYIGKRIRNLEDVSSDVCLHNTLTRLSRLLLKHLNAESHKLELINNLPNDEIASLIGTTRAVVNRHIQVLKNCGAISVKRKQIDVKNLEVLISMAEEKNIV